MEKVPLGLYVIRGDNMYTLALLPRFLHATRHALAHDSLTIADASAVIGELNEQLDKQIDFSSLRAQPLQHVLH
jgi:hypothetical protein